MDVILAAVPSAMCVSLRTACRNRDSAETIHHFSGRSSNRVSVLQTVNYISSLQKPSISPSQKGNSLLKKRHCGGISSGIVKSAASSGHDEGIIRTKVKTPTVPYIPHEIMTRSKAQKLKGQIQGYIHRLRNQETQGIHEDTKYPDQEDQEMRPDSIRTLYNLEEKVLSVLTIHQ